MLNIITSFPAFNLIHRDIKFHHSLKIKLSESNKALKHFFLMFLLIYKKKNQVKLKDRMYHVSCTADDDTMMNDDPVL